jgi:poly-gamma-glutamate system protein
MAALVVRLLWEGGVRPGDRVAVGLSSSFPALNLALGTALDAMEVEGVIISSLGSSSWGANHPNLTWLDMESLLYQAGVIGRQSIAFSAGGRNDLITGFSREGQEALLAAVGRRKGELINTGSLAANIERRLEIYGNSDYAAYINVGGSLASLSEVSAVELRPGLQKLQLLPSGVAPCSPLEVAQTGVVINLLEVGTLALRYGLPLDPYPLPPLGIGSVYMYEVVPLGRLAVALWLSLVALLSPLIVDAFKKRSKEKQIEQIGKGSLNS